MKNLNNFNDLIKRVERYHSVEFTSFVNPDMLGYLFDILDNYRNLSYSIFGDDENLEYKMIAVYPDYMEKLEKNDFPIRIIKLFGNNKIFKLTHRDVLGALMSLGIVREKIGDIVFYDDNIKIFVVSELSDYISINLGKIKSYNLENLIEEIGDFEPKEVEFKDIFTTVKSLRLDAFISSAFNISRSKAAELIKMDKVKINYRNIKSPSKILLVSDMISVRGFGRFIFFELGNFTKKDRVRVTIKLYI